MRRWLAILFLAMAIESAQTQGKVVFEQPVYSPALGTQRMVRVYLPPSYERDGDRRFPVVYVQDGQNAFTTVGTNVAFGWGNWALDRTVTERSAAGRMSEVILVAVDCSEDRYAEYRGPAYPYGEAELAALKRRPPAPGDNRRYEAYRRFLVEELKPRMDAAYRTRPGPSDTAVLGSSMGGLCSLVLAWERPDVFGKVACLSGAFQVERGHFLTNVLSRHAGPAKPFRVYLDSGVVDYSGGDDGRRRTERVATELRRIGWRDGVDLNYYVDAVPMGEPELERAGLRRDKWEEAQRSQHNEFYWRMRAWRALEFLFPAGG